ncbi:MAG: protein-export chaperone SecB [Acetobacteraceae bacterium]
MTQPSNEQNENSGAAPSALSLSVNVQFIKDLSFEVPSGAATFASIKATPQIGVNIDVQAHKLDDKQPVYEVAIAVKAEAQEAPEKEGGVPGKPIFILELTYASVVTIADAQEQTIEPILLIEVPRLLFPFVRSIISDVTRDGGFAPVVLHPIDFVGLWQSKRAQQFPQTEGNA